MNNPFCEASRIYLRPLEPSDGSLMASVKNDPAVRTTFFTHTPVSIHGESEAIAGLYGKGADYLPFAICLKENDKAIGIVAWNRLDLVSGAAIFSICICDAEQRGRGFASEATETMLTHGFDVLNLHRVQLHVFAENERAIRTYEKCGFVREGVLREAMKHDGKYCDFLVMGILEDEWRARKAAK